MSYSYRIFDSIAQVPPGDWERVCTAGGANVFTSPRFLRVIEQSLAHECRMWHVVFHDDGGEPVACATICSDAVDVCLMAAPWVRRLVACCRRAMPRLGRFNVLFCGVPVSVGQNPIVYTDAADVQAVVRTLDAVLADIARRCGAGFVVYKEFPQDSCRDMDALLALGYRRARTPSMHACDFRFDGLDAYCAELKAHYRADIRRSQKKFTAAGLTADHLRFPDIERVYTPDLHRLYEAVVHKSETKLELLPRQFFLEFARQFPDECSLTVVHKEGRIVAFNWGLLNGRAFHFVFCGVDYTETAGCDLYFNLMYQQLDFAFRSGAEHIELGQTADAFKARLGARPHPMFAYVRGRGAVPQFILWAGFTILFPEPIPGPAFDIFKSAACPPGRALGRAGVAAVSSGV